MTVTDITLPEVKVYAQAARFFRQGGQDLVEISFVGAKDTLVEKTTPQHMAQFRSEWDAYCDGRPIERRAGTALTELPDLDETRAENYIARNVHTLEELAALSDAQCQGIGHGALTDRQAARRLVIARRSEARDRMQRAIHEASAAVGPRPVEPYVQKADLETLRSEIADLKQSVAALAELVGSGRRRGKSSGTSNRAAGQSEVA